MSALALALALAAAQPLSDSWGTTSSQVAKPWRVYTSPSLHVGVRPAAYVTTEGPEWAVGCTVQVTR
jgi:hypothetical protein